MNTVQSAAPVPVLEIGGTHVTAALVELQSGTVTPGSLRRATLSPSGGSEEILATVISCGSALPARAGQGWGVAIPGPFDYARGIAWFEGVGKFEALYGVDVGAALAGGLPGPPGPVTFLNDADAFLLGEWLFGAAAGSSRCIALTLGTGIGSAFLADGEICQSGPGVPPEGRADLLTIGGLPLEDVVSTRAIEREYRSRTGEATSGTAEIARRARGGQPAALEVLKDAFVALGGALKPWLRQFKASVLVVGGSMSGSWDVIGPALVDGAGAASSGGGGTAEAEAPVLRVVVAANPEQAALLGAAAAASRRSTLT
ncbi:MAG TPA: ROK family protein [Acidimicrobiales bacterium]|nr:ROK family protein [Acidimicrobiales bacterium]